MERPSGVVIIEITGVVLTVAIAAAALAVSILARNDSTESLDLAKSNESRLDRQEDQQYANKLYLGEPPTYVYAPNRRPAPAGMIWQVVINASGLQAENVWAENDSGQTISIFGVQRCSMYALPLGFNATRIYFTDPNGNWIRASGGQVEKVTEDRFVPAPDPDSGGNSVWDESIDDCAG